MDFSCFNTSYVSVQVAICNGYCCIYCCFNTSYVSVQELEIELFDSVDKFQYILCVGSRYYFSFHYCPFSLFQYILCVGSSKTNSKNTTITRVSIHLMCRFKICRCTSYGTNKPVSIHLMCRFKEEQINPSTYVGGFNTSYVSVQVGLGR